MFIFVSFADIDDSSESCTVRRGIFKPVQVILITSLYFKHNLVLRLNQFFILVCFIHYLEFIFFTSFDLYKVAAQTTTITDHFRLNYSESFFGIKTTITLFHSKYLSDTYIMVIMMVFLEWVCYTDFKIPFILSIWFKSVEVNPVILITFCKFCQL